MSQSADPAIAAGVASVEAALNRLVLTADDDGATVNELEAVLERPEIVRNLNARAANAAFSCFREAAGHPTGSPAALKWSALVLAACPPSVLPPPAELCAALMEALQAAPVLADAQSCFHVLDLLATVTADNSSNRNLVGELGMFRALADVARRHKKDMTVLFAVAFAYCTLTMADVVNGGRAIDANGLQILVEIFKSGVRAQSDQSSIDSDLRKDVLKHAREGLMNLTKVPFDSATAAFAAVKWGTFGTLIEVDELKLDVEAERARCLRLLAAFRASRVTTGAAV